MNVHVVVYDCGDFYCDGDHILGIFYTQDAAQQAIDDAPNFFRNNTVDGPSTAPSEYTYSIAEWMVKGNLNKSEYERDCDRLGVRYDGQKEPK